MALSARQSAKLIAKLAEHVLIKPEGIEKLGKHLLAELSANKLNPENFSQSDHHPKPSDPWAVDWIFLVDTLNFCFWTYENVPGWRVDGQTGYFALCAAINRAQREGVDITNPAYYAQIDEDTLSHILRSDNDKPVPLLKERVKCLREVGQVLLTEYHGTFKTCIELCEHSSVKLLQLIIQKFPCFRDEASYKKHHVGIYKRAQILIGDLWACFHNKSYGNFKDIQEITMFADYRVPQSLIYYGAMEYTQDLNNILETDMLLKQGCEMEVEIRGCSIHAVELIKEWCLANSPPGPQGGCAINSIIIDHFLWDFRRKHAEEISQKHIPFHKTLSIYY